MIDLPAVGDKLRFPETTRLWWECQAASDRFAVLTQQVPFCKAGTRRYTVMDAEKGIRGPCNLIGQGYGDGSYSREQCEQLLAEFHARTPPWPPLKISHRNNVPVEVTAWVPR